MMEQTIGNLFDQVIELPSQNAKQRLDALVGLDTVKERLHKQASILLNPTHLESWSQRIHGSILPLVDRLRHRPPLILLAGDVGTGKTTLAETFADRVSREDQVQVRVMRLSLRSRGRGASGEMTALLSQAFDLVREKARIYPAIVLVIDEADALAQSRELAQMHHEDRAGVNALIRGVDSLISERLRVLTVMCTNRLEALDPAVRRRAADLYVLERPNEAQRCQVFTRGLVGTGVNEDQVRELARLTGPTDGRDYPYTYSDLVDRLLPSAVLAAYPDAALTFELVKHEIGHVEPTKPFSTEIE